MANLEIGHTADIITACRKHGLLRNQAAYVLATAYWETARTMEPVKEAFWLSDNWRRKNLRYYPWYGRGFVQLTWERNYIRAGEKLGMDLTTDADAVMEPSVSAEILVVGSRDGWFTGKKLSDYVTLQASNYRGARRVINGTDKAAAIAEIARDYEKALKLQGFGIEPEAPVIEDTREGLPPKTKARQSTTIWSQVTQWAGSLGAIGLGWWNSQDPNVQIALIGGAVVVVLAGGYILRERIRKMASGLDV